MTNKEAIEYLNNHYMKHIKYLSASAEEVDKHNEVMDLAIEALEKQIPKNPVNYDSVPHSRCPACNNAVKVFEDTHEYHYCLYCGQCLDWSDEE